jgi:hypothetical protein
MDLSRMNRIHKEKNNLLNQTPKALATLVDSEQVTIEHYRYHLGNHYLMIAYDTLFLIEEDEERYLRSTFFTNPSAIHENDWLAYARLDSCDEYDQVIFDMISTHDCNRVCAVKINDLLFDYESSEDGTRSLHQELRASYVDPIDNTFRIDQDHQGYCMD